MGGMNRRAFFRAAGVFGAAIAAPLEFFRRRGPTEDDIKAAMAEVFRNGQTPHQFDLSDAIFNIAPTETPFASWVTDDLVPLEPGEYVTICETEFGDV